MRQIKQSTLNLFLIIFVVLSMIGCGTTRAVLVPPGELIRIGPDVRGQVYVWNGTEWILSDDKVIIPEGWFAGPLDTNDINKKDN